MLISTLENNQKKGMIMKTDTAVVPSAYGHLCEMGHGVRIAVGSHLVHSDVRLQSVHLIRVTNYTELRLWLIGYGEFERRCEEYGAAFFAWRADDFDNFSAEDAALHIKKFGGEFLEHALLVAKPDGRLGVPLANGRRREFFFRAMSETIRYSFGARLKLGLDPHVMLEGDSGLGYGQFRSVEQHEPYLAHSLARDLYNVLAWGWRHFSLPTQDQTHFIMEPSQSATTAEVIN